MQKINVDALTNQTIDQFQKASYGLFSITGRFLETFEQGIYGVVIAKPTKRMKIALGADRELLVVISTFPDQQQRTIKYLKHKIEEAEGRFESTLAIVVHFDSEGGNKLKNWGRSLSISVLPLGWLDRPESAEQLENLICTELYSHDPFDITGPVSDDAHFYGRRDEAIDLARKLQGGQIRSCLGIRKIGKTSVINRVIHEIEVKHKCLCIMIDCSRDDIWPMSAGGLLGSIADSISTANKSGVAYFSIQPIDQKTTIAQARETLHHAILESGVPVILIFDEIDYITPGSPTNKKWFEEFNIFWRNFRAIYQEIARGGAKLSILIGGVSAHWFTVESINGIENAALAFVPEEYLSPMATGATVAMIKKLGRIAGIQFDDASAEYIAKVTANMPYWARKACSYIHRIIPISERPFSPAQQRVKSLVDRFVSEEGSAIAEVALQHLFRVHPDLRQPAQLLQQGTPEKVSEKQRRSLRRYGIFDQQQNTISGAMISSAIFTLSS